MTTALKPIERSIEAWYAVDDDVLRELPDVMLLNRQFRPRRVHVRVTIDTGLTGVETCRTVVEVTGPVIDPQTGSPGGGVGGTYFDSFDDYADAEAHRFEIVRDAVRATVQDLS